ncbi:Sec-independent protein translocase protein TatB [Paracraurococcus lichenis]|uniref:Sec-independent protein translocase protein TatB n=1 Tax=Paracraurococcus lichenis TaxID=3064888 RepID=A0ABT9DXN2_9PROT|nr:Sec-independent protein translocase protein TatB [Paracraurococcus sp. LOR1-02]MDO9708662.1 Sec-independent protein translocase protein TatB [Paracraurococcus sp. LOR1-02]
MFDLAWSEIALIGVVALVVIGPKDLPEAIRGLARGVQKLRRMAGEFQSQADELVREANLDEVRNSINEIRSFNIKNTIEKAVDADGSIRKTFTEDPLKADYAAPAAAPPAGAASGSAEPPKAAPSFIPPAYAPAPPAPAPVAAEPAPAPAFVPPAKPAPQPAVEPATIQKT